LTDGALPQTTTATDSAQINSLHIDRVSFEHSVDGFGIGVASPRISWRFGGSAQNWLQQSYDIRIQRDNSVFEEFHVESAQSNLVPWPPAALQSRESAIVSVKANGADGVETGWHSSRVEASLLHRSDWRGEMISATEHAIDNPKRPFYVIQEFEVQEISVGPARLYVTAFGLYDIELNGQTVGTQVLKPGWTSYAHRLYFQTFDVTPLLKTGKNVIRGLVAEGWYSGRLGFLGGKRNLYGTEPALLAQLMIGEEVVVKTDSTWKWAPSEILTAEIYDGEVYDARVLGEQTSVWQSVKNLDFPAAKLLPDLAPIRRMEEVTAKALVTTPSG
jgi:alpha-L-rhamnosidase